MTPDDDIMAHPEEIMGSDRSQTQKAEVQMIPVTGVSQSFFSLKEPDRSHLGEEGCWLMVSVRDTNQHGRGVCTPDPHM